jgi:hemerythrin
MLDLAQEIRTEFLEHMAFEIEFLKEINQKAAEEHEASHSFYKEKFDLECKHAMSEMMRVLMVAEMVKECVQNHICEFDLKDFRAKIHIPKGHPPS